jgi:hypothetical protein
MVLVGVALMAWVFAGGAGAQATKPRVSIILPSEGSVVIVGDVRVTMSITGATVRKADETHDPRTGHFHLYLDKTPEPGKYVPKGVEGIWHTPDRAFTLKNVSPGVHTLILLWAYGDHVPFSPWVTDTVMFEAR